MPAASLRELDTTSQSWLVLPKTQGITGYRCVCLSRAAQLQSWGLAVSLVSLSQACCLHRRHSCATSAFCANEAVHRKVCWLTCCVRKDRRLNIDLRFALASKLVPVAGPTVTYGPYCSTQSCVALKRCHTGVSEISSTSSRSFSWNLVYIRATPVARGSYLPRIRRGGRLLSRSSSRV